MPCTDVDGFIETLGGRRFRFEWEAGGKFSPNLALNFPIQGTAAEIAVEAVIRIDARLRRDLPRESWSYRFTTSSCLRSRTGRRIWPSASWSRMSAAFSALLPDAPVTDLVDAHAGPNWAAAKGE